MGHHVGSETVSVIEDKVAAILRLPEPTTKKLVQSFLGMCNFYHAYLPNFAEIAAPLTELTKAKFGNKISLNNEKRASFIALKKLLASPLTLTTP